MRGQPHNKREHGRTSVRLCGGRSLPKVLAGKAHEKNFKKFLIFEDFLLAMGLWKLYTFYKVYSVFILWIRYYLKITHLRRKTAPVDKRAKVRTPEEIAAKYQTRGPGPQASKAMHRPRRPLTSASMATRALCPAGFQADPSETLSHRRGGGIFRPQPPDHPQLHHDGAPV
jgi:hypothetical protein